jgi:hypothetical protein
MDEDDEDQYDNFGDKRFEEVFADLIEALDIEGIAPNCADD